MYDNVWTNDEGYPLISSSIAIHFDTATGDSLYDASKKEE